MIDIKNYKPEWTPVVTAPTGGTTVTRDALAPTIGQQFFNTDNGNMESYDGTAWGTVVAKLPPRQGVIGLPPTPNWRINVTKSAPSAYLSSVFMFRDTLFLDSLATVKPTGFPVVKLVGTANVQTGSTNLRGLATDNVSAPANSKYTVEYIYPSPISPVAFKYVVPPGNGYLVSFTVQNSYDNGTTWNTVDTFVNLTAAGITKQLPVPTYPATPVAGQRFFNTSTGKDNRWDANLSQWIPIVTGPVWQVVNTSKTLAVGEEAFTDTTAAPITLTLPLSPNMGDSITVHDSTGTWATNAVTLARNGASIMKLLQDMTLTVANKTVTVVYNGTDWRVL